MVFIPLLALFTFCNTYKNSFVDGSKTQKYTLGKTEWFDPNI